MGRTRRIRRSQRRRSIRIGSRWKPFYDDLDGDDWANNTNWKSNSSLDSWYGVTFSGGRVTKLRMENNKLNGTLPAAIGNLTGLTELVLTYNNRDDLKLRGSIPPEIGNLSNLRLLSFYVSNLGGSLPSELGNLRNLEDLSLGRNNIGGNIPTQLGNMRNLTRLDLGYNNLTGSIPSQLGNLSRLTFLGLEDNNLSGSIPSQLGNLRNLQVLGLTANGLVGSIPSSFNNFRNVMTHLYMPRNELTGSVPLYLLNFTELRSLYLAHNNFAGCEPNGLRRLVRDDDLHNLNLELCPNPVTATPTKTPTPLPTNTRLPTNTPDPNVPTSTPEPKVKNLDVLGEDRGLYVWWDIETGVSKSRVFWRAVGQSSYRSSSFLSSDIEAYTITGWQSYTTYEVYVQGYAANNQTLGPPTGTRRATPYNLEVRNIRVVSGVKSLVVSWTQESHHAIYDIHWQRAAGGNIDVESGYVGNTYTITRLDAGETYNVKISATDADNRVGKFSDPVSGRVGSGGAEPERVAGPTMQSIQNGAKVRVTFRRPRRPSPDGFITQYELRVYNQQSDTNTYITHPIPVNQYGAEPATNTVDFGSEQGKTYRVAVRARFSPEGWTEWSNETSHTVSVTQQGVLAEDDYVPTRPGALALTVDDTDADNPILGVNWHTPSTGATNPIDEYELHYSTHLDSVERSFNFEPANNNAQQSVNIIALRTRTWYYFRLRARNQTGYSDWSPTAQIFLPDEGGNLTPEPTPLPTPTAFVPSLPTDISAWAVTDVLDESYVFLNWGSPDYEGLTGITSYVVRYRWSGQDWIEVNRGQRAFLKLEGADAVYRRRYELQVAAINNDGQGLWSGSVYATPLKLPDAPDEPTVVAGNGELRVTWTRPDSPDRGVSYYMLFYAETDGSNDELIERVIGTSYTIRNLTSGEDYKVTVSAVSSVGQGGWSVYGYGTPN